MALAGALVRGGGAALARNIMGRKKKVKASVVAPKQKVVGQEQKRPSAIVKSPTVREWRKQWHLSNKCPLVMLLRMIT